jgi:hypothetical protein
MFRVTRITYLCALVISRKRQALFSLLNIGCWNGFCCSDAFMVIMVFSVVRENTKVAANLFI